MELARVARSQVLIHPIGHHYGTTVNYSEQVLAELRARGFHAEVGTAPGSWLKHARTLRVTCIDHARGSRCSVAKLAASIRQGPSPEGIPARLPRCPRRGLDRQSQEDSKALAGGRAAGAAAAAPQTARHLHRATDGSRRCAQSGMGGGLPIRRDHRRAPLKIVTIIDEHTRECLGGMVERSITGEHLVDELNRLAAERGMLPAVLRCDNAPNWLVVQWPTGPKVRWACTTSHRASRGATAMSNRLTPASATSA
jgi:hypothetical protein